MRITGVESSAPWFRQAASDTRTAEALLSAPSPIEEKDIGCHVAAMCAQAIEKSLKGYLLLNGATPAKDHRPDKYLTPLMTRKLLRYADHYRHLSALFTPENKAVVRKLLDLTPGGLGRNRTDLPNTEYPWTDTKHRAPIDAPEFAEKGALMQWIKVAKWVTSTLSKLWSTVHRYEVIK